MPPSQPQPWIRPEEPPPTLNLPRQPRRVGPDLAPPESPDAETRAFAATTARILRQLAGDAMKNSHTPVLGICSWGVITGRAPLTRPSQPEIRARIRDQITERNQRAPSGELKNIGTDEDVLRDYARKKARSWADPQSFPVDIGTRVSFVAEGGDADKGGRTLESLNLIAHDGRPDITLGYPDLRTGKSGRGSLGLICSADSLNLIKLAY